MHSIIYFGVLFLAKVLDNALSTTKTIMIQRSRWILAGIAVILSDFIYYWITKRVVSADGELAMLIVSVAGGIGCSLACLVSDKLSKDRTYVNVIMSDNLEAMKTFRDFLAEHHITNVAADTYTRDWNKKTISIIAYPVNAEVVIIGKAIITFVLTLIIGVLAEATVGIMFNMPGIGAIVAIAVAGACTVYFGTKKER